MNSLAALFGIELPQGSHLALALCCVIFGTVIAYRGVKMITWTTRILVPALLLVGIIVVIVGFTSVPGDVIWNYTPKVNSHSNSIIPYILSTEANFAFVITLVGGMAEIPRLCKSEKSGYYAGVLGQGLAGSFFVVVGAVMTIAMEYVTGKMIDDPTVMMATLSVPALGLTSLLLVALLFVDFFFVRKQKLDFYSAYEIKGHDTYRYTKGFNIVGMVCLFVGIAISLLIYNPVTGEVHSEFFFCFTPTGCSLLGTGLLYYLLCKLPPIRRYIRKDISVSPDTKPFDRMKEPPKQNLFFMPFIWLGCFLITCSAKLKIVKSDKRGIKPPYLVLGTHHSFTDFYVTPLALFPHRANYVSELEGFENYGEWIYRQAGCLGTRKFIDDMGLIKNIKRVTDWGGILVLYPEARYANVGTSSKLPKSVAKLVKMLKVPVVTLNMKGNYLQSPIWNLTKRKEVRLHTDMTYALTAEDVKQMTVEEIYEKLSELLSYDEYQW